MGAFNASNGFKPIEEKNNVAILPQKIIHKSKRPVITASNSILSNRTHTRNAKETAVPPPAPPSGIAPHMNAISTTSMPTTTSERKTSVQTPPRYTASSMKHVPRTASPPRPPSANNGERPPSAGGVIPMVGLLPPPITTTMEGASSSSSLTREKTYAHASPKRRRMPPPRNRQAGGALMLESEQAFVEKNENVEKKNGKDSVSPTNTTSESIDVAVEKAQSSSSDLNDLRYRREKGRVKARVKDASAALDAALA